ncbi:MULTISPECIES: discoidin domain-containing protein, partial [unclassified Bacillus (in: firmicutes)]|uniref:discoidin domain-containing protein n=1 Tax=unclassified Bacillus (in: firmicutes) TaxID=185979 RepID=UPI0030F5AE30
MNKRKYRRLQKPIKVFATSAILATTLFTPIMTNHLGVQAETVAAQTVNQYEQREFDLPATGSYWDEGKRERRSDQKNYMPTGIYIKPNEEVTVEVSGTKNINAIIGTHGYDKEWGKEIELTPGTNKISSPNGGLLGLDNYQNTGTVKVKITQGGSPVPFFELGKHTKEDWIAMMNKYPDAHAVQLKSKKSVLTVTQDSAKKYIVDQNPIPLLEAYDKMIQAQDKVSGLSETDPNPLHRPTHRMWAFYENTRGTWGIYEGWDGVAFVGAAIKETLDVNKIGPGQMHEAGHTRQQDPLTWSEDETGGCGMTEVTVNLYTLAAYKELYPNRQPLLETDKRYDGAFQYLKQTNKDYTAVKDSNIKQVMLWQLYLAYGEEFYANLHKLYRELPDDQLPKTDAEKIQAFIYNTSKVAKQNVLPFFDQWGLKATPETRQKIEALNYPTLVAPIWDATDSKPVKPLATLSKKTMKASANSQESSEPASNAIDGNPNTIWHSQWNVQNQYPYNLTLELDKNQTISQIDYLPRQDGNQNGRILNYNIYTSVDGVNYEKVSSGTWENNSDKKTAKFDPVTAKYVKLEVTNGNIGYASAAEVDVLTDSTSVKPYVLSKSTMKASANSEESGVDIASHAIDGKTDTMWHSKWNAPNQFPYNLTLELDKNKTISKVDYLPRQDGWEDGRILSYNIYTSIDGSNYTKVSSGTWENNSDKKTATFNPVTAKYVKIEVTNGQNG